MRFDGFPDATFAWFDNLERDNSKAYVDRTRATFDEHVRGALERFFVVLQEEFGGELKLFRQNRDVRFSKDKSPYKTRTYGVLTGLAPGSEGGLYAELSADGLFAGSGYHGFAADQLERYRAAVLDEEAGTALQQALADAEAASWIPGGEALKTAPRGFPRDHPRVRLLRHKGVFGGRRLLPGDDGIPGAAALDHARASWRLGEPIVRWLDAHVGPSAMPPEARARR